MKKYRLIKEYPGSPDLGIIVDKNKHFNWYQHVNYAVFPLSIIENNPEYWEKVIEKVIEKEYEIIEYTCKNSNVQEGSGIYQSPKVIRSVKRLSDGEVFTIGDKVEYYHRHTTLESIYYNEHNQLSFKVRGNETPLTGCFMNNHPHFRKVKEPLLFTEDGVEVHDPEQTVYYVTSGFDLYPKKAINVVNRLKAGCKYKYFSSEKAAKNYIKLHKPVLSYSDVLTMFDEWNSSGFKCRNSFKNDLTDLVKKKL